MGGNLFKKKMTKLMSEAAEKLKTASSSLIPREDFEKNAEMAREATELEPSNPTAWINYALALLLLTKRDEAWAAYQKGVELSGGNLESIRFNSDIQAIQFIRMHEEYGDVNEAEEQFTLFANHNPLNPIGWCALGAFYIRNNRLTDASLTLINGLHEVEHEEIYLNMARVHALQGSFTQAIDRIQSALKLNPNFFQGWMCLALYANRSNHTPMEQDAISKAKSIVLKHPELQGKFDDMLTQINATTYSVFWQNELHLEESPKPKPKEKEKKSPEKLLTKSTVTTVPFNDTLPETDTEMELVPVPDHEIIDHSEIGLVPISEGEAVSADITDLFSEAENESSIEEKMEPIKVIKKEPSPQVKVKSKTSAPVSKATEEPEIKETPKTAKKPSAHSEDSLREVAEKNPNDPDAWYTLGEYLRTENNLLDSEIALKKAITLNPVHADALQSLGMLLLATNRIEESDIIFQRVAALDPAGSDSWITLAKHQLEKDDLASAGPSIQKAIESDPDNYEAWHLGALFKIKQGKVKDAEKAVRRSIEIKPSFKEGWKTLAQILDRRGKNKDALEAFQKAADLDPDDSIAWSNVGVALAKNKRYDEALRVFQKALDIDDENIIAWRNLAALHRQQGRIREADAANAKFIELQRIKANGNSN